VIDDPIIPVNQLSELAFIDFRDDAADFRITAKLVNLRKTRLGSNWLPKKAYLEVCFCPGWGLTIDPPEDGHVQSGDEAAVKMVPGDLLGMEPDDGSRSCRSA